MSILKLNSDRPNLPKQDDNEILDEIKKNVQEWLDWYSHNIENYKNSTKFAYLEDGQWSDDEIIEYKDQKRPRLTFNMLPRMVSTLIGEYFDFSPDLQVRAIDSTQVPQDAIDLRTNILREISFKSKNNIVYETATECALTGGYGAFLVGVEPENRMSFNLVPRYYKINDPTRGIWDKNATELNKQDGSFCGYYKVWRKEALKQKYPKAGNDIQSFAPSSSIISSFWETTDEITVIDWWKKVFYRRRISLLSNNTVVDAANAEAEIKKANDANAFNAFQTRQPVPPKVKIEKTEERDDYVIRFYRAIHNKVLEYREWDGMNLPLIFQPGYVKWIDGKEYTYAFTQWLKDTQRAYNYARSEYLYRLKLTRYEPFTAREDVIKGYEDNWKNVYVAKGVLPYTKTSDGAKPERFPAGEIPQSLTVEIERSYGDLQRISGRFDANLGAPSNETSGVAILNRQRPGNKSVQNFFNNSLKAIETGANNALDLIKHLFDTERLINIALPNGERNSVVINTNGGQTNNITDGSFLVEIKATANFELQRLAQLDELDKALSKYPEIAQIMPDILIQLTGIKDAPLVIKRIQKNLIPQITLDETKDPELQAELKQNIQQQQVLQQQQTQLETLAAESKIQSQRMKALNDQLTGIANIMNAQTNSEKVGVDSAIDLKKINAEENRTVVEALKQIG